MNFLESGFPCYPIFSIYPIFILPPRKKDRGFLGTVFIHLQIFELIFVSFCVFPLQYFDDFWMILLFSMFDMVCCKDFSTFLKQMKHKAGNRFYPPNKNNKSMGTLQTKQT